MMSLPNTNARPDGLIKSTKMWKICLWTMLVFMFSGVLFQEMTNNTNILNPKYPWYGNILAILILVVAIAIHELLHGLGFLWGGLTRNDVDFGINWHHGTAYAHAKESMTIEVFRRAALLPALILGLIPYVLGVLLANGYLGIFGILMLAGATGDFCIVWASRKLRRGTLIQDSPVEIGIQVVACSLLLAGPTARQFQIKQ